MYNPTIANPDDHRVDRSDPEPKCPWCDADGEDMRMVSPRNVYLIECGQCGCEWDERDPTEYRFVYDDPRELAEAA